MGDLLLPDEFGVRGAKTIHMNMSLDALVKTAEYIVTNGANMKSGDTFTITGTDQSKIKMHLI